MGKYCDEKKRKTSRRAGAGGKGRRRKKLHCPGFISSHYDPRALSPPPLPLSITGFPPPSLPLTRHPFHRPRRLLTLNFLSCITALRLSSKVEKKKIKKGIYKWKKPAERENDPLLSARKRGASSNLSISLVCLAPWPLSPAVATFFLRRTRKHDKRAIDPKTLYGENGSETRNTDGNLHL